MALERKGGQHKVCEFGRVVQDSVLICPFKSRDIKNIFLRLSKFLVVQIEVSSDVLVAVTIPHRHHNDYKAPLHILIMFLSFTGSTRETLPGWYMFNV